MTSPEDWVAARGAALTRFAYLICGSPADAQDLAQEALVGALPRWDRLARSGDIEPYLKRSVVNGHISRWRKWGRVSVVAEVPASTEAVATDEGARFDDSDAAWRLLATLPSAQRAAVVLRFYEELSYAEIAEQLACAEATARSHVHRALTALRATLTESAEVGSQGDSDE